MDTNHQPSVAFLNNTALGHFLAGDFPSAVAILRQALILLHSELPPHRVVIDVLPAALVHGGEDHNDASSSSHHQTRQTEPDYIKNDHRCTNRRQTSGMNNTVSMPEKKNWLKDIFHRPALFNTKRSAFTSSQGGTSYSMYNRGLVLGDCGIHKYYQTKATLIFNLGLVYHNLGVHGGVSAAFSDALALYTMSLESLGKEHPPNDDNRLQLAVLNNMGNIYTNLFQPIHTQWCFDNLSSILNSIPGAMVDDDYKFFLLNAIFHEQQLRLAPAA